MKNVISALVFVFLCTGCTKEVFISNIVAVDKAPAGLEDQQTTRIWITKEVIDATQLMEPYACNYYDNSTGTSHAYQCGKWYKISAQKYWGFIGGKTYISNSYDTYAIFIETFSDAMELVKTRETVIGQVCTRWCDNPLNYNWSTVSYIEK